MFQYHPQDLQQQHASEGSTHTADLYMLFNKFSGDANESPNKKLTKSKSTPVSVEASPRMSEKEDSMDHAEAEDAESPNSQGSKSRRMSLNKAERRAEHNAIERARRECLNSKFQQLADALPNLQNHRRPSKGQIVEKALDWVKQNMTKEDRYQYQIIQLQNENKRLLTQISIVQEQQHNNGIITPPASSSSTSSCSSSSSPPVAAPFPAALCQQQFPAHSTPTAIDAPTPSTSTSSNSKLRNTPCYYQQQPVDEISLMYASNAIGYNPQFHAHHYSNAPYNMAFKVEDDNDSNSSIEEQHLQMSYADMSQCTLFDMNHPLAVQSSWTSIPASSKSIPQNNTQYTYPIGHPMYTHY
ncbi:hypothetical protein MBANPS3_006725 [Mucor bainieri]